MVYPRFKNRGQGAKRHGHGGKFTGRHCFYNVMVSAPPQKTLDDPPESRGRHWPLNSAGARIPWCLTNSHEKKAAWRRGLGRWYDLVMIRCRRRLGFGVSTRVTTFPPRIQGPFLSISPDMFGFESRVRVRTLLVVDITTNIYNYYVLFPG